MRWWYLQLKRSLALGLLAALSASGTDAIAQDGRLYPPTFSSTRKSWYDISDWFKSKPDAPTQPIPNATTGPIDASKTTFVRDPLATGPIQQVIEQSGANSQVPAWRWYGYGAADKGQTRVNSSAVDVSWLQSTKSTAGAVPNASLQPSASIGSPATNNPLVLPKPKEEPKNDDIKEPLPKAKDDKIPGQLTNYPKPILPPPDNSITTPPLMPAVVTPPPIVAPSETKWRPGATLGQPSEITDPSTKPEVRLDNPVPVEQGPVKKETAPGIPNGVDETVITPSKPALKDVEPVLPGLGVPTPVKDDFRTPLGPGPRPSEEVKEPKGERPPAVEPTIIPKVPTQPIPPVRKEKESDDIPVNPAPGIRMPEVRAPKAGEEYIARATLNPRSIPDRILRQVCDSVSEGCQITSIQQLEQRVIRLTLSVERIEQAWQTRDRLLSRPELKDWSFEFKVLRPGGQ